MKTNIINRKSEKRNYSSPTIVCIQIDNEISLVLNSFAQLPGDPFAPGCDNVNPEEIINSPY